MEGKFLKKLSDIETKREDVDREILKTLAAIEKKLTEMDTFMKSSLPKDSAKPEDTRIRTRSNPPLKKKKDPTQGAESCHQQALRECFTMIVDRMNFKSDKVIDHLVQNEGISQSDQENILSYRERKKQNRCFYLKLRNYDENNFRAFIDALEKENHTDLANKLKSSLEEKKNSFRESCCIRCKIIRDVNIADVIDTFYENRIIGDEIMDLYINDRLQWRDLIKYLNTEEHVEVLSEALKEKYNAIKVSLEKARLSHLQCCLCKKKSQFYHAYTNIQQPLQTDESGNQSDVSSTGSHEIRHTRGQCDFNEKDSKNANRVNSELKTSLKKFVSINITSETVNWDKELNQIHNENENSNGTNTVSVQNLRRAFEDLEIKSPRQETRQILHKVLEVPDSEEKSKENGTLNNTKALLSTTMNMPESNEEKDEVNSKSASLLGREKAKTSLIRSQTNDTKLLSETESVNPPSYACSKIYKPKVTPAFVHSIPQRSTKNKEKLKTSKSSPFKTAATLPRRHRNAETIKFSDVFRFWKFMEKYNKH